MIKKLTLFLIILVSIVLICNQETQAGQIVKSYKTSQPPLIDGMATEDVWENVPTVKTFDPIAQVEIQLKSVHNDSMIFFLVTFPDRDESRQHRNWIWNNELQMYIEGPQREDVFVFKWRLDDKTTDLSIFSDEVYTADIWYWKAVRTDPQGFADDKIQRLYNYPMKNTFEVTSKSGRKMYIQREGDAGKSAYKSKIYVDYEGDEVHRYLLRKPSSSRADVKAKGVWQDGFWTIEFARKLVTGNDDDVNFQTLDASYRFGVSRYEIAGRQPEKTSEQPLFGSGDISEMLTLEFQ